MKLNPHKCPGCGGVAIGALETVTVVALLSFSEDGDAEPRCSSRIYWKERALQQTNDGKFWLECANSHRWTAQLVD